MSGFSEREVQLMACAFQAMKTPPEIDYSVMARLAGMSHPGSASNAMRAIRRKLDARVPGGATASSNGNSAPNTPKKTPRSAAGKKRNAAEMAVGGFLEDDEDVKPSVDSPSRKKGKGKATTQAKPAARSAVVGDDDDGAVRVKSERTEEEHDVIEDDGAEEESDIEEV
ncbi:hypothetical protein SLS57_004850 [Botryosphaeria dothidea]